MFIKIGDAEPIVSIYKVGEDLPEALAEEMAVDAEDKISETKNGLKNAVDENVMDVKIGSGKGDKK